MKKYLSLLILLVPFLTGCVSNQVNNERGSDSGNETLKKYHEIETGITNDTIEDVNHAKGITQERDRLKKEGKEFWYVQDSSSDTRTSMKYLHHNIRCAGEKKEDCSIISLFEPDLDNLSSEFNVEKCDDKDSCFLINGPTFLDDLIKRLNRIDGFYYYSGDLYTIGSLKGDDTYTIFKNDKEIFSHKMVSCDDAGSDVIEEMTIVMNSPSITFCDWEENQISKSIERNIWYRGEILNDEYSLDSSSHLFSFEEKTGFVGENDGQMFIFFNGQKISQDFNEIRTDTCCAIRPFPIEIDENGILFFLAKREDKYFFVEVDLKEYLD